MKNKNTFAILILIIAVWILLFYTKNLCSNNSLIKLDINSWNAETTALEKKISNLEAIEEKYKSLKIQSIRTRQTINTVQNNENITEEDKGLNIDKYMPILEEEDILDILTNNEDWIIINEINFKTSATLSDWLDQILMDIKFSSRNLEEIKSFLEYLTWEKSKYWFFVNTLKFENKKEIKRSELIEVKMQLWVFKYSK